MTTAQKVEWIDAWQDWDAALAQVPQLTPCPCCGERCFSQLEGIGEGGEPYEMCAQCDPGLDEYGSDWLCPCRQARGDANWELPDSFERKLGLLKEPEPAPASAAYIRLVEEGLL